VIVPDWIWLVFIFVFGCCIGSFLNVVVYRLPRGESLVRPPSACPKCGERIRFYDNIPLVSWLLLGRKCRHCKAPISARYFIIELLTGLVFTGLFVLYFRIDLWGGIGPFLAGGWFIYLLHIILLAALIATSAIDLKLWVIPVTVCWFVTVAGLVSSAIGVYVIEPAIIRGHFLLPSASVNVASLSVGAAAGLVISLVLLATGLIKRSYESEDYQNWGNVLKEECETRSDLPDEQQESVGEKKLNHRLEVCKEIVFLLPIIICSAGAYRIIGETASIRGWWVDFSQHPVIAGLLGSLWGYFVGCGVVWATRIFGTLAFGKEAMGLGDVHLMGAAGAVIGPVFAVAAFFIAPFFGLGWAGFQIFFKKTRQIPYSPFLSLGIFTVMILHDRILSYLILLFYR
jgi:leader peptidase (prepilin peptidase)/N-methyltransferase